MGEPEGAPTDGTASGAASGRADVTVACYTFPHYHRSALSDRLYGPGWTEYLVMRGAGPWFPEHPQPRVPLLGELDERDPATWERYVDLAADHGVDVLLWDWYWYEGEPALHEALEEGFLRAPNHDRVKFALMWVNHPWTRVYPTMGTDGSDAWEHACAAPDESLEDAWRSLSYLAARYFHHPSHWSLGNRPFLSVWDPDSLARRYGVEGTHELLAEVRALAARMGHEGIHVHACFPGGRTQDLSAMGFDSYGYYTSVPQAAAKRPASEQLPDYDELVTDIVEQMWPEADARSELPFFPGVAPGWDTTPRFLPRPRQAGVPRDTWPGRAYWGDPVLVTGETPAGFKRFVEAAVQFLADRPREHQVVTIGCWNEWTEGHYLLPDTRFGYGMLHALQEALTGVQERSPLDWTPDFFAAGRREHGTF
jgi:hypothetical protein